MSEGVVFEKLFPASSPASIALQVRAVLHLVQPQLHVLQGLAGMLCTQQRGTMLLLQSAGIALCTCHPTPAAGRCCVLCAC
jgi:hypothetical protein